MYSSTSSQRQVLVSSVRHEKSAREGVRGEMKVRVRVRGRVRGRGTPTVGETERVKEAEGEGEGEGEWVRGWSASQSSPQLPWSYPTQMP